MDTQKTKRKKIPADIEAEVIFQSDRQCCVDQKRGDHIHHIDGDSSNYDFDNLALLCFDCHNEASIKGSLRKKLTPKAIKKFRDHHYNVIRHNRYLSFNNINQPIKNLTSDDLIKAATTANILIEIIKIKDEYYDCVMANRNHIIKKLEKLSTFNNTRIAYEVFSFLSKVAYETRVGMPEEMVETIFSLITDYFPPTDILEDEKQLIEIGTICNSIAFTLIYDSTIHIRNFNIASIGLLILKFVYLQSENLKIAQLTAKVNKVYNDLEIQLKRPERTDLSEAKELVEIFQSDLKNSDLSFPVIPQDLYKRIEELNGSFAIPNKHLNIRHRTLSS